MLMLLSLKTMLWKKNCVANIFVGHNVDEISGLVHVPYYVIAAQVGESSQVVNTNKGKRIVVYNGNELEEEGEKTYEFDSAISSEDDTCWNIFYLVLFYFLV
jgi:hypothetical protein